MSDTPILYSFRRCPYAMRARMALWIAGATVELREVKLSNKPPEMIEVSPKGTVPVLVVRGDFGHVMDESLIIMRWALRGAGELGQRWLSGGGHDLIATNDGPFKKHLDRYKYPTRYPDEANGDEESFRLDHRAAGLEFLHQLDARLEGQAQLCGGDPSIADIAIFPFVRQFANTDRAWFDDLPIANLQRWLEGHLASDLFKSIMPKFDPWKAGDDPIFFGRDAT